MANEVHYSLTRDEYAARCGKHRSCFEHEWFPLCGNGSYHATQTRDKSKVTCPVCLAKLKEVGK